MHEDERPEELTPAEREALRALSREKEPPPGLEDRVVAELRRRGRLTLPSRRWTRPLLQSIAALLLLILGVTLGRWSGPPAASAGEGEGEPRFMLLLYEPPGWSREAEPERVEEYGAWVRELRTGGRYVAGAPLGAQERVLRPGGAEEAALPPGRTPGQLSLGGYFVVGAADLAAATALARECPHLRHGGTVVVRPLGP